MCHPTSPQRCLRAATSRGDHALDRSGRRSAWDRIADEIAPRLRAIRGAWAATFAAGYARSGALDSDEIRLFEQIGTTRNLHELAPRFRSGEDWPEIPDDSVLEVLWRIGPNAIAETWLPTVSDLDVHVLQIDEDRRKAVAEKTAAYRRAQLVDEDVDDLGSIHDMKRRELGWERPEPEPAA